MVFAIVFALSFGKDKDDDAQLGGVKIDDLFQIEKMKARDTTQVDQDYPEFPADEDLQLESLEIEDIDILTFGEYEDFLNKYYDSNYLDLNARFLNQKEFIITGIGGITMPVGANVAQRHAMGSNFGIIIDTPFEFYLKNILIDLLVEVSFSSITSSQPTVLDYRIMNIIGSTKIDFLKLFYTRVNISMVNSNSGFVDNETSGWGLSGSLDLGLSANVKGFNVGAYVRAQSILSGLLEPPMNGGGTGEIASFGVSFGKPFFIQY